MTCPPMRLARSLEEYRARPIGTYLTGPTFVVWWHNPQLNGISFWGRPEADHIQTVTAALQSEFGPGLNHHASIVDARYMDGVDPGAFYAMSAYGLLRFFEIDGRRRASLETM